MSKRRAVILAVTIEYKSQAETARSYGVSEATVSRWLSRYRSEGDAAYEPRSTQVPEMTAQRVTLRAERLWFELRATC